jgi:adenylate kinase family enzyme
MEEIKKHKKHIILDGFPRNLQQARSLHDSSVVIDYVIALDIPHQTIMDRMAQRWIHFPSGRTYAYDYNPPKKHGKEQVFLCFFLFSLFYLTQASMMLQANLFHKEKMINQKL